MTENYKCLRILEMGEVTNRWNVVRWKRIGRVRNQQAGLTNATVNNRKNVDRYSLIKVKEFKAWELTRSCDEGNQLRRKEELKE
jgi:hypothetical protein